MYIFSCVPYQHMCLGHYKKKNEIFCFLIYSQNSIAAALLAKLFAKRSHGQVKQVSSRKRLFTEVLQDS